MCNSAVIDGIGQEVHGRALLESNPSEASVTSTLSSPLESMPSEMARDVDGSSTLSENQAVQHDAITTSAPPLSQFHRIVLDKFPDLKSTMLEGSDKNSVLEITHRTVHYHPPAGYCVLCKDCCVHEQQ